MDLFSYEDYRLTINEADVFMIKEFKELFNRRDNTKKEIAISELQYIYLMYDWKSPYVNYTEQERKEAALIDCGLKENDIDYLVKSAIEKYLSIQDTLSTKLLKSARKAIDELRIYYDTLDLQERDELTNKPITNHKDVISSLKDLGKVFSGIKELEHIVKTEQEAAKSVKGGVTLGLFD